MSTERGNDSRLPISSSFSGMVAPLASNAKWQSKVSFAPLEERSLSLTMSEQKPMVGADFNKKAAITNFNLIEDTTPLLKKNNEGVPELERPETPGDNTEVGSIFTGDYDPENPDILLNKIEKMQEAADGRTYLQEVETINRAKPPWWFCRWTDLLLFLNSTRNRMRVNTVAYTAAVDQLTADIAYMHYLEQSVCNGLDGKFCSPSAQTVENLVTDIETNEIVKKSDHIETMAQLVPLWRYIGTSQRMTHELLQNLKSRLQDLLDILGNDEERMKLEVVGIPDKCAFDGVQRSWVFPALQCAHASTVTKSIISDLFISSGNLNKRRAHHISDGFRTQTPLIHSEYITEEDIRPIYDPTILQIPIMNEPPVKNIMGTEQSYRSFIIHIDYIRFRPSATPVQQQSGSFFTIDVPIHLSSSTTPLPMMQEQKKEKQYSNPWNKDPITLSRITEIKNNRRTKPIVSFTKEDELISTILDYYEPYRMMELNLLPQLKSRRFYQEQLENLHRQASPTEEQKQLINSLSKLYQVTCELERFYIKSMVTAWQQIARLRGENPDEIFIPVHSSSYTGNLGEETIYSQISKGESMDWIDSQRRLSGITDGVTSLLSDNTKLQTSTFSTRFRMYLRRYKGDKSVTPYIQEDDLLKYTPVFEGIATSPQNVVIEEVQNELEGASAVIMQGDKLPYFKVLVFARTNPVVPPQFVGSTSLRTLSATKILFINETFELRTMQEPQEILLHVISIGNAGEDNVVATIHVPPSLTRSYLLLPLQTPISFTYRSGTHGRHVGSVLSGIISLSTTWTTTQGMTVEEIENLFLHGDADPMDPQYKSLLNILCYHYLESKRRIRRISTIGVSELRDFNVKTTAESSKRKDSHSSRILKKKSQSFYPLSQYESERLLLLQRRWLFRTGRATPQDTVESRLFSQPIPLEDIECHELRRRLTHVAESERRNSTREVFLNSDLNASSLISLSLSPLPRKGRLELWQERLQHLKMNRTSTRKPEDHELLERHVILPKLRPLKFIRLTPESQLNPRREERPKTDEINREALISKQDSRVVVHIMKATSLPQRADGTPLEPFVEVSFVYETVHSRSEVGTSPSWFETLNIPFCPPDFDDETLSLIEDDIVISVYDKLEIQMSPSVVSSGAIAHETHYRTERRLLGTLRVPFFSLYEAEQARMEGQYPLSTPRWVLGYSPNGTDINGGINQLHSRKNELIHAYPSIQLYVALWPPLRRDTRNEIDQPTISRLVTQLNVSAQLQYLHNIAMKWRLDAMKKVKNLSSVNPVAHKREIEPFVFCTTGDLTLVCRYLLANGGPPPLTVKTVEEAIRFVSLLLFRIDTLTWGDNDVWSTNAELLRTREGDYEELSLLLAHFLRFLAPDEVTFVVTGRGTVHRHVVMVLHSFGGELRLIDPRTGIVSPVHDPHLTLFRDVHMVFSHDQLWANIQLSGSPHRMDWSLNDKRFWLPCFNHQDENVKACLPFIAALQREILPFAMPDINKEQEIEKQLRKLVRRALVTWRNNRQPAFHYGVASVLQTLLKEAENEHCKYASVRQSTITMRATELLNEYFSDDVLQDPRKRRKREGGGKKNYTSTTGSSNGRIPLRSPSLRMMGSPVNAAYRPDDTSYHNVLQQVFETSVHEVGTNAVSFAIGVYVKGYTSEVYSMWVFLVAIYEAAV